MTEESVFAAALEKGTAAERTAFLDEACSGNAPLRERVEALLRSHEQGGSFLAMPALQRAAEEREGPAYLATTEGEAPGGGEDGHALDFLAPSEKPGSLGRLGHYEVQEVIGRGGMGIVLRAFDEKLHRVVAIKVMALQLATSAAARKRFVREGQAAAAVRNDHVVNIYAVEETNGLPYLIMEYISGPSLQERLDQSGPLQVKEILRIGMQTAAGLAAAHAQGLIHRDVKPANILLENGVERVKITDFGLARAVDDASLTQSGVVAGTPQYMAPEQARGELVDHRADLFSLGSVLYALCTGRSPFRASGTMAVLKRVCEDPPRPIREINPEIPGWLVAIVARLHAKDPAERFQSAAEVGELLGQHLAHLQQPSRAPLPDGTVEMPRPALRTPRASRRRWVAAILVLSLGGLGLAEATGVTKLAATVLRVFTPDDPLGNEVDEPTLFAFRPPLPGPLDALDSADIPAAERYPWQPAELVGVLGEHRGRQWGAIQCVAYSADGKWAASAGHSGKVYVWDGGTLHLRTILAGHTAPVWCVAFSPDGHLLLSAAEDGTVRLWDLDKGQQRRFFAGHSGAVWSIAFSADGRRALSGGQDRIVRLWDVANAKEVGRFADHTAGVRTVAFSPDGTHALSGSHDGTVRLWNLETGKEARRFEVSAEAFRAVFLPDGQRVLTGGDDHTVRLWDARTGKELWRPSRHADQVFSVAVSPNGRALSSGRDRTVRVWDTETGKELRCLAPQDPCNVVFSPDGRRALSGGWDGSIRLWDLESGKEIDPVVGGTRDGVLRAVFSPDGRRLLAFTGSDAVRLWALDTGKELFQWTIPDNAWGGGFFPGGVLCAGGGGMAAWDAASGKEVRRFADVRDVWEAVPIADGRRVLTAHGAGILRLWDAETGRELARFPGHRGPVGAAAVSPDWLRALSGGWDKTVRLWDLAGGKEVFRYEGHTNAVWAVAFSPDGRRAASSDDDGFVRLWDLTGPEPKVEPLAKWHTNWVRFVGFSPDGRLLASAGADGRIVLWEVAAGKKLHEWQLPEPVFSAPFAPDGRHLAAVNANGTAYLLRLPKPLRKDGLETSRSSPLGSRR